MKKLYAAMLIGMLACGTLFAGCGDSGNGNVQSSNADLPNNTGDTDNTGNTDDVDVPNNTDAADDAGTEDEKVGGVYELSPDDVMHSVFFDLKINSVDTADELEDYVANEGYIFLIVNVSITNTFTEVDPMSYADFPVLWGEDEGCYPDSDFSTAFPEEYDIAVGETVTGDLIYTVPKDKEEVIMEYYDLWADGSQGDTFNMHIAVNAD